MVAAKWRIVSSGHRKAASANLSRPLTFINDFLNKSIGLDSSKYGRFDR